MALKYYAVRAGFVTGLFRSWDECKKSVEGYPGAEYKSFGTKKEALSYLAGEAAACTCDSPVAFEKPVCPEGTAIAYVDGSYDVNTKTYAFGCVIAAHGSEPQFLSGTGNDIQAASARNVAGELMGAMTAVRWAVRNGYSTLCIYHDYTGIEKWYTHKWKAESYAATMYLEFMNRYRGKINLSFSKVEAHTGVPLNEEADRLAKEALGIKKH